MLLDNKLTWLRVIEGVNTVKKIVLLLEDYLAVPVIEENRVTVTNGNGVIVAGLKISFSRILYDGSPTTDDAIELRTILS